jgi:tetratricopeptide (TPR) repeat protein
LDNKQGLAYALDSFANICWPQGKIAAGRAMLEESLQLYETLGDRWGIAYELSSLGTFLQAQGECSQAKRMLEQALAIAQAEEYDWITANALMGRGDLASRQGDYATARTWYEKSLAIYRSLGEKGMICWGLFVLAFATFQNGDSVAAQELAEDTWALACNLNDRKLMIITLHLLSQIAHSQSDHHQETQYLTECVALCQPAGFEAMRQESVARLGMAMLNQAEYAQALPLLRESLALTQQFDSPAGIAFCGIGFAVLAIKQGQLIQGTRLLGAIDKLLESPSAHLHPMDRVRDRDSLATAQAQLDEATFATAWADGQAMTVEQIVMEVWGKTEG